MIRVVPDEGNPLVVHHSQYQTRSDKEAYREDRLAEDEPAFLLLKIALEVIQQQIVDLQHGYYLGYHSYGEERARYY